MKVKFLPQNIELEIQPNQSVMQLALENGIFIKSVCKGLPSCAECRVRVVEGDHNVLSPLASELGLVGSGYFLDGRRLSCQLRCFGDVVVDLTEQVEKEKNVHMGKKLKGGRPSDAMESMAVRGNLIEQHREDPQAEDGPRERSHDRGSRGEQGRRDDRGPRTEQGQRAQGQGQQQRNNQQSGQQGQGNRNRHNRGNQNSRRDRR